MTTTAKGSTWQNPHEVGTPVKFHQGNSLLYLAKTYPDLFQVVLELVQNAIDTDVLASRVFIEINYKTRFLVVRDNGRGASVDRFNNALATVAQEGRKGKEGLGRFGLGLISPLGKCDRFTFTSCPFPQMTGFIEWKLSTAEIKKQNDNVTIPRRSRTDLTLNPKGPGQPVWWRSEVALTDFTTDVTTNRIEIDQLIGEIRARYNPVLRRNKTKITVEITDKNGHTQRRDAMATAFSGKPLPLQTLETDVAGRTTFRLFIAPKTKNVRAGKVVAGIMGNEFRVPFHLIARAMDQLVPDETLDALLSGHFEGEIISEHVSLHPNRQAFEKNDAFIDFCCAIQEWYEQFGSVQFNEAKQSREEERLQDLGMRSMGVLKQLFKEPEFQSLMSVINGFGKGTIGVGHTDLPPKQILGEQDTTSISVAGNPGEARRPSQGGKPSGEPRDKPAKERPGHWPPSVAGPNGQVRTEVKDSSFGLQFKHVALIDSHELWKLDTYQGILTFNTRHPTWQKCDVNDSTIMKLQEFVAVSALTLETMPDDVYRLQQRKLLDELVISMAPWILSGDRFRSRPSAKKAGAQATNKPSK